MDDKTWDSLFSNLPKIIFAICGGLLLLYKEVKSNKVIKENTDATKESVNEVNKAHESISMIAEEAKEISEKQKECSDEMLRLMQERLRQSDEYISGLIKDKDKKDS